jgi:hypothetical protein
MVAAMRSRATKKLSGLIALSLLAAWLAVDNGPALLDEWRLRGGTATHGTVVAMTGGAPRGYFRRLWDDLIWGRGRRVTYEFVGPADRRITRDAFVNHSAAAGMTNGSAVSVRYLGEGAEVSRIDGEPGLLVLSFRLAIALAIALACFASLRSSRPRRTPAEEASRTSAN